MRPSGSKCVLKREITVPVTLIMYFRPGDTTYVLVEPSTLLNAR
jgi:hypothetical protein